jgi:predicted transcriptional regulator of viral defense system
MQGSIQTKIYLTALRHRFIRLAEASEIAGKEKTARMTLWRLAKQGSLQRIRNGFYAAVPPERKDSSYEVNRYLLFDRAMNSSGALAFHSALELHGAAQSRFNSVFYLTTDKKRPFEFQDITYRPVWTGEIFGRTTIRLDDIPIQVTNKERTFLDCIRRPDLCGGLEEYLKSVEAFTLMSPLRLLDYLERFGERSLYQRAGLILTYLKDRIKVDEALLETLRSKVGQSAYYLAPGKRGTGRLVKEWNVLVPRNFEELMRYV